MDEQLCILKEFQKSMTLENKNKFIKFATHWFSKYTVKPSGEYTRTFEECLTTAIQKSRNPFDNIGRPIIEFDQEFYTKDAIINFLQNSSKVRRLLSMYREPEKAIIEETIHGFKYHQKHQTYCIERGLIFNQGCYDYTSDIKIMPASRRVLDILNNIKIEIGKNIKIIYNHETKTIETKTITTYLPLSVDARFDSIYIHYAKVLIAMLNIATDSVCSERNDYVINRDFEFLNNDKEIFYVLLDEFLYFEDTTD